MPFQLTAEELERYDRQILIEELGVAAQKKLKRAKVFICGAGGLGSPVAVYLAAAGIGNLTIVDNDRVSLSNLNRQVLHHDSDIGRPKVDSAKEEINRINPHANIHAIHTQVTENNVHHLIAGQDIIVDALDNPETRYIMNKAALEASIPFIHGAVYGFEGRLMTIIPGQSTCLRCLYRGSVEPSAKFPVIGVTPAVIGALQATETVKYLAGAGDLLTDRLLVYDGLKLTFNEFKLRKNPMCDHCGHL